MRWVLSALCGGIWFSVGTEPVTCGISGKTNWVSRDLLPREQSAPFGVVEEEVSLAATTYSWEPKESGLFFSGYGKASEHAVISSSPVSAVGGASKPAVISGFSAEVTTPSPCPLRNLSSTPESYQVTLSDPSPVGSEGIKGNRSRNSSPAMSRKSSVVSWSGRPCEQLVASSTPSGQSAPFDDAGKSVVLDDASGHPESGELAVISTCPLKNVSDAPEGVSVCCGTTGCTESGLKSVVVHGSAAGLEPDECGTSRNVLPRERPEPCFPAVGATSESALMSSGLLRDTSNTPESSGVSHGTVTRESVTSSFSVEVTVPWTCPLNGSSGELHRTITDTHTAQRKSSSALPVSFVPSGVELVSRNTYVNRKRRNRETCWRQSKALKRVQREAKRKLVAQPEISHEAAEAKLKPGTSHR